MEIPQRIEEGLQLIIPNQDFSLLSELISERGFCLVTKQRYSDRTQRVEFARKEIPQGWEDEKTWEETRQDFLRCAPTDGKMALEGEATGYLPDHEGFTSITPWNLAVWDYIEGEYRRDSEMESKKWERDYKQTKSRALSQKRITQKIKGWSKEFSNYGTSYSRLDAIGDYRTFYRDLNLHGLVRRLTRIGILSKSDLIPDRDLEEYAGHGLGLFNTGCTEYEFVDDDDFYTRNRLTLNQNKTFEYVQEHFTRGLMSADVAFVLLRKIKFARNSDYQELSQEEQTDLVFKIIDKTSQRLSLREKRKEQREKRVIRRFKPYPLLEKVFGELRIVGFGKEGSE